MHLHLLPVRTTCTGVPQKILLVLTCCMFLRNAAETAASPQTYMLRTTAIF